MPFALHSFFAGLLGLMALIGLLAPREQPFVQRDAGAVDLAPWRWARPTGLLLVLVALTMYVSLADVSVLGGTTTVNVSVSRP